MDISKERQLLPGSVTRVLYLINYAGVGGTEKYLYSVAEKLNKKECIFYLAYSLDGSGLKPFEKLGIETSRLVMRNPWDIRAALKLKALCRKWSIDVIHTQFLRENYIAILSGILGNKAGIIYTRHMLNDNPGFSAITNRFLTRLNKKVIAVSARVRDQLIIEGVRTDRIELIYTGVDLEFWAGKGVGTFREEYDISDNEVLITSVARFSPEKGHEFLLNAVKYFKESSGVGKGAVSPVPWKFVLVGDGILFDETKKRAETMGLADHIIFTGHREDVRDILKSSDIFISHSVSESFGIAILEALAAGLPAVVTDSGGTAEIVNENFGNGIIVDYGDVKSFAEGIRRLIDDAALANAYKERGLAVVREYFDIAKTAEKTYNLYKHAGGRHRYDR